ncbi:hypothetical protein K2173_004304 [Erythroxylum novogranatense]|uniref:PRONE domain-containing protein n=1 Tax=Erythroxylum novogranatense TaxID=1862640 RepID=A0AAV8U5W0_9ROSI|nr:hypothetical protein K2173_004304 [Erythroxylum novogranatense]
MVGAVEQEQESYRSRLFNFRGLYDTATGRNVKSLSVDDSSSLKETSTDDSVTLINQDSTNGNDQPLEKQSNGSTLTGTDKAPKSRSNKDEAGASPQVKEGKSFIPDMELMKEKFTKLLLGEDMSGGGKGVSSALALSNAITNLAASVFGEQKRLEPMPPERMSRWRKEIDWLLSVTDYIVEMLPSQQKSKDGSSMEIMTTRQRTDLLMNIPALRKLDAMLIECLDNFKDQNEFSYVSNNAPDSEQGIKKKDDKWWLPTIKVPPDGLSDNTRKFIQYQKDCVNQVLKAAMAINAQVLAEIEIPESYIESLPKNGRASLGDSIYRSITVEFFDPDQFLSAMDLSSEHKILDLKNRIEASIVIWRRKMNQKDSKSAWGSAVSLEKRELFEERAETILLILKQRFPGIPQSSLEISKIQYNRDVGQAILESYSRILESLASTVMSRIEDVLYADYVTRNPSQAGKKWKVVNETPTTPPNEENTEAHIAMTLSDFMGWSLDQNDTDMIKDPAPEELLKDEKAMQKPAIIVTNKRTSYLETIGALRSPTARH